MSSPNDTFEVELDMPQNLPVTDAELAILETYLGDIIAQMLREEAADQCAA